MYGERPITGARLLCRQRSLLNIFRSGQSRKEHRRQDGDDSNDDQQLDEGEARHSSALVLQTALPATCLNSAFGELAGHRCR